MANGTSNGILLKWIMGIVGSILVASIIGLWSRIDFLQTEIATSRAERVTLRRDMDQVRADTKEILLIVTDIRIYMARGVSSP